MPAQTRDGFLSAYIDAGGNPQVLSNMLANQAGMRMLVRWLENPDNLCSYKWSIRASKVLARMEIQTFSQLAEWTADEIVRVLTSGPATLSEVRTALESRGKKLTGD
jgi:hypothetical protein